MSVDPYGIGRDITITHCVASLQFAKQTIVGYLCGTPKPALVDLPPEVAALATGPEKEQPVFLELPLRSVGITSTTYVPFFELADQLNGIKV